MNAAKACISSQNTSKCCVITSLLKVKKVKGGNIAFNETPISELRSVTCRMGSHSDTCHPTQMNAPRLNPSQISRYSIYLPWRDERLS